MNQSTININEEIKFPITPAKAVKFLKNYLTKYEITEILDYPSIFFIGKEA